MLGPLCDQVDKRYSFVKHNKVLKKNALSTMARRIATEITWTGYPTKNIFIFLIFVSYMGHMPYTFVHFGGFLCIKDARRRGNKTTVLIFSLSSWSLFCWYMQNLTREAQMKYIPYTGLLIGCGKKWEILRHFQGKLCGKKGLLCSKIGRASCRERV